MGYLFTDAGLVGLIIAISELFKRVELVETKWLPIVDVVAGLILGIVVRGYMDGEGLVRGLIFGLALGLSACGLFSGTKNVVEGILSP